MTRNRNILMQDSLTARTTPQDAVERPRLLSREELTNVMEEVKRLTQQDQKREISIYNWWFGSLRWARNQILLTSDTQNRMIGIERSINGAGGTAGTNQFDNPSLDGMSDAAKARAKYLYYIGFPDEISADPPHLNTPEGVLWSNPTYQITPEERSQVARQLIANAEQHGMLSAGYIEIRAGVVGTMQRSGDWKFHTFTQAQCSMTVRHPKGEGSGWAGQSGFDWNAIDKMALADRALQKCLASVNPVRIEPGRYTTILEPQAVCDFLDPMMKTFGRRVSGAKFSAEEGKGPFVLGWDNSLHLWRTKMGLKIVDERITVSHDPMDPVLGVIGRPGLAPVTWIDRGVLTALEHGKPDGFTSVWGERTQYSLPYLNDNLSVLSRPSYRVAGGDTSIEEMIASTKRGVLVTRLYKVTIMDVQSLLSTGVTRDGLWLIENGKITKAVKNMRFTESPLFSLNQLEQIGPAVPVFRPVKPTHFIAIEKGPTSAIVPTLKVNDFSFIATTDAI